MNYCIIIKELAHTYYLQSLLNKNCVHCLLCRLNRPLPNPVYEDEYTNKGGMALFNMTSNPSYMTANEVVSTRFAPGTEEDKEVDQTYEVLPFETDEEGYKGTTQGGQGDAADDGQEGTIADV